MKKIILCSFLLGIMLILNSCIKEQENATSKNLELPTTPYEYSKVLDNVQVELPFDNTPFDNQISDHGATLGRVLFYDPNLSINNQISCGTCHKQSLSFADEFDKSLGFEESITTRNSPAVLNMRFSNKFFWDMSSSSLEEQVILPIQNHIEMGMEDLDYLADKLANVDYYPALFENAFGNKEVTPSKISKALAQFVRSINSFDSSFDREKSNDFVGFDPLEKQGLDVFLSSGCNNCHTVMRVSEQDGEVFFEDDDTGYGGTGLEGSNIGLQLVYDDPGIANGMFKIPSLRNLAFTGPYMHDGRFNSLQEVIEHYNSGVVAHEHLDFRLKDVNSGAPKRLNLDPIEKVALEAFLLTLTDETILVDPKFSDPFKY